MNESGLVTSLPSSEEEDFERVWYNSQPSHPWQLSSFEENTQNGDFAIKEVKAVGAEFQDTCWDDTREYRYWLSLRLTSSSYIVPLKIEHSSFSWSSGCCWWFGSENPFLSDGFLGGGQWLDGQSSQWSSSAETWTFIQQSSEEEKCGLIFIYMITKY